MGNVSEKLSQSSQKTEETSHKSQNFQLLIFSLKIRDSPMLPISTTKKKIIIMTKMIITTIITMTMSQINSLKVHKKPKKLHTNLKIQYILKLRKLHKNQKQVQT